jgi:hypothetical protein
MQMLPPQSNCPGGQVVRVTFWQEAGSSSPSGHSLTELQKAAFGTHLPPPEQAYSPTAHAPAWRPDGIGVGAPALQPTENKTKPRTQARKDMALSGSKDCAESTYI